MSNSNSETLIFMAATIALLLLLTGFIIKILHLFQKKQLAFRKDMEHMKQAHEKSMLQAQLTTQEQIFREISRNIHDNISLSLTLSKLHLNTLYYPGPVNFKDKIDLSINLISEAIHSLSNISASMNPDIINKYGLLKAIENEMGNLAKTGLYSIDYEVNGTPVSFDTYKELAIFRIIQESLNNIIKHAQAKNIYLHIHFNNSNLELSIHDDGIGFEIRETEGIHFVDTRAGLKNIRHRVKMIEGTCEIISTTGNGTLIKVSVPLLTEEIKK
jgi:signal transduction histidine kinase